MDFRENGAYIRKGLQCCAKRINTYIEREHEDNKLKKATMLRGVPISGLAFRPSFVFWGEIVTHLSGAVCTQERNSFDTEEVSTEEMRPCKR